MANFPKFMATFVRIPQHQKQWFTYVMSSWYSQLSRPEKQAEDFRVLELVKKSAQRSARRKTKKTEILPPRTNVMPVDQDWSSVWPGPRSFHPASVPLPLHQGYNRKGISPGKFANAELMKIPNFLHLTPPAIKKHCEALKRFCTSWPEDINEKNYDEYFPVEVITSDYCFSSPDVREPLARIVVLKVKLSTLKLDAYARDKLLRLVGARYNPSTDILTLTTDRCPLKKQNYEYALYLLTALYHESHTLEPWESEKTVADMEFYEWEKNISFKNVMSIMNWPEPLKDVENIQLNPKLEEYKNAISDLMNKGEDQFTISKYKQATKKLFNLPEFTTPENTTP